MGGRRRMTRYTVTRTDGREVEVVRGLLRREAERLVERDRNSGWESFAAPALVEKRRTYR